MILSNIETYSVTTITITYKMKQYFTNHIILALFLTNVVSWVNSQMNPPASATTVSATAQQGTQPPTPAGGPGSCDDSAIAELYAMIQDIIMACSQLETSISQGYQFSAGASSPVGIILQNIQWQNMVVSCDMITKTKQMADSIQAASGSTPSPPPSPSPTSISSSVSVTTGGSPNADPTAAGASPTIGGAAPTPTSTPP